MTDTKQQAIDDLDVLHTYARCGGHGGSHKSRMDALMKRVAAALHSLPEAQEGHTIKKPTPPPVRILGEWQEPPKRKEPYPDQSERIKALEGFIADAVPILDVLIDDREEKIGDECEVARDLRNRAKALQEQPK